MSIIFTSPWTVVLEGAVTTIREAREIIGKNKETELTSHTPSVQHHSFVRTEGLVILILQWPVLCAAPLGVLVTCESCM